MKFGPYNLDLLPRLVLKNVQVDFSEPVNHIWGKNGIGKSTLMNEIVKECVAKKHQFAFINQNYRQNWLWWYSLAENLELAVFGKLPKIYGREAKLEDYKFIELPEIKSQLDWLGPLLESKTKQVEFSKQPEISTIDLSGGQLQRVILLRELLRKPEIVLLDEAFSALDKKVLPEILSMLRDYQKTSNFTLISIAHDKQILEELPGAVWELTQNDNKELEIKQIQL